MWIRIIIFQDYLFLRLSMVGIFGELHIQATENISKNMITILKVQT